jgi:hypothetical protein
MRVNKYKLRGGLKVRGGEKLFNQRARLYQLM